MIRRLNVLEGNKKKATPPPPRYSDKKNTKKQLRIVLAGITYHIGRYRQRRLGVTGDGLSQSVLPCSLELVNLLPVLEHEKSRHGLHRVFLRRLSAVS